MIRSLLAIVAIAFAVAACDQSPQAASPAPPPAPPPMKYWMVFFDLNSATITPKGGDTITEAATIAKGMPNSRVTVTGYTDTDGPPAYNMALSLRRANAVKDALVGNGVSPASITVSGRGEEGLLVATPDNVKMESNRRVQIVIQ
jgi:outer membrane protein OmpA-like peptidoglycan-associated protein